MNDEADQSLISIKEKARSIVFEPTKTLSKYKTIEIGHGEMLKKWKEKFDNLTFEKKTWITERISLRAELKNI